jgi:hypothetical protein
MSHAFFFSHNEVDYFILDPVFDPNVTRSPSGIYLTSPPHYPVPPHIMRVYIPELGNYVRLCNQSQPSKPPPVSSVAWGVFIRKATARTLAIGAMLLSSRRGVWHSEKIMQPQPQSFPKSWLALQNSQHIIHMRHHSLQESCMPVTPSTYLSRGRDPHFSVCLAKQRCLKEPQG